MSSKGFISHCKNLLRAQGPVELLVSSLWREVWGEGRESFRRRDAQLSSSALLSQLQTLLMGLVLLLPSMALVPQGKVGRPHQNRTHQNRTQNLGGTPSIPEPREVALPSLSGCELCCHLWMPEHHQHSRPSTSSTLLTSPSPNSLPDSLQPLLPFCASLSPHALLSPPLSSPPTALAAHIPLPAPPCSHISGLPTPITAGNSQAQPGSWSPIFP